MENKTQDDVKKTKTTNGATKPKRNKRTLTLTQKITILDMMNKGQGSTAVARALGLSEATVRSVKKNEEKIRKSVAAGAPKNAKLTYYTRDTALQKTEKILIDWIDENARNMTPVVGTAIRKEAKRIYDQVKADEMANNEVKPGDKQTNFVASKGWYEKFKKRYTAYANMPDEPEYVYTEPQEQEVKASNDDLDDRDYDDGFDDDEEYNIKPMNPKSVKRFPLELSKIIEERGYRPEQIFNADETGMYWKRLPKRTFLHEAEKYSQDCQMMSKDRLSVIVCANAAGDCVVKPLVVHRSRRPMAFKGKNKRQLGVMWRSNHRSRVTTDDFVDWFHNCFAHEARAYLATKGLPFKVLLVLDTASCHPISLQDEHCNIKVVFLPADSQSYLQPMDQGVISNVKAVYTKRVFTHLLAAKNLNPTTSLIECWWDFSLANFIKYFCESLHELKVSTLNSCWQNLWSPGVDEFSSFPNVKQEIEHIVDLAHCIGGNGFKDLLEMEVEELLESHKEELKDEELAELLDSMDNEEEDIPTSEPPKSHLSDVTLERAFKLARDLQNMMFDVDPFMERWFETEKLVQAALTPYREMYREIHSKRETKMKPTFKKSPKKKKKIELKGPFPGFF